MDLTVAWPSQVWVPLPPHPSTWLHLSRSPHCTHFCLPQPHPTLPSPLGNSEAKLAFLVSCCQLFQWGDLERVRASPNTLPSQF